MVEGRIENAEIDLGAILDRIKAPDDVAKLCTEAAKNALSSQSAGRAKREWLAEEELAGTEGDVAWSFYLRGQIDELTDMLQAEVYDQLRDQLDRDGDEGSEDEEPEEGDAEDEGADSKDEDDDDGEDDLDEEP